MRGFADLVTGAENALPAVPREAREPEGPPVSPQKGYTGTCISGHSVIDLSTHGGTMHLPRESSPSPRGTIGGGKRSEARGRGAR